MNTAPMSESAAAAAREDAAAFGVVAPQVHATDSPTATETDGGTQVLGGGTAVGTGAAPAVDIEAIRRSLPADPSQSIPLNLSRLLLDRSAPSVTLTQDGAAAAPEILPGYRLLRSIGSGGFGEVYECDAPGGLKKAVKVVYGTLDERRAERELTALSRVKEVRHPFRVGLERIEIVNRQLVIVSELADRSLKERYLECRAQNRPGIPRDELLRYMRDAAEALDYLYDKHSLQHLDVKPENLLLLGEHVKVADFGLMKDLNDTQMSMVGGVTPMYSPPEVLDGRPNRNSDQYSLAIAYQEMLTGEPPFNGRTAGQLAAQHMHSAPVLASLPTADRYAVGRALAKSPAQRFSSNREFVDALINPPKRAYRCPEGGESDAPGQAAARDARTSNSPLMRVEPRPTRALPPVEASSARPSSPVIVIGVGGLGGSVVTEVKRQVADRFGDPRQVPTVHVLYLDTDRDDVSMACHREDGTSLGADEVLTTPLRTATEYRDRRSILLSWLSRRWLYNVPRSLKTEGIRPLGRLALVDHAMTVRTRIATILQRACDEAAASRATGTIRRKAVALSGRHRRRTPRPSPSRAAPSACPRPPGS